MTLQPFSSNFFLLSIICFCFLTTLVQFCDCPFKRRNGAAGWMCAQGAYPGALNLDLLD